MRFLYLILPTLLFVSCKSEKREFSSGATPNEVPEAAAPAIDVKNVDSLVGQALEGVKPALEAAEIDFRVVEEDGEPMAVTMDFSSERLNFKIKGGVIIAVIKG